MKLTPRSRGDDKIWSPCLVPAFGYGLLLFVLSAWVMWTFEWDLYVKWFDAGPLDLSMFGTLSLANALFTAWLAAALQQAFRAAPSVRKGQIVGVILAIVLVGELQLAAFGMRRAAEVGRAGGDPPTVEQIRSEPLTISCEIYDGQSVWQIWVSLDGMATLWRDDEQIAAKQVTTTSLSRFRELLIQHRYCKFWAYEDFVADISPREGRRLLAVYIGEHARGPLLYGREYLEDWDENDKAESYQLRRILPVWAEVLGWVDHELTRELRASDAAFLSALGTG